ncbi:MAG TPA: hypothetical protein VIZ44_03065 [Gaiellaceae bacterium]
MGFLLVERTLDGRTLIGDFRTREEAEAERARMLEEAEDSEALSDVLEILED